MREDIFEFWSRIPDEARKHPDDVRVFERADTQFENAFPIAFMGPLRTAPVVLLFLSPGFSETSKIHSQSVSGRKWYKSQRGGCGLLPSRDENESGWAWWTGTVRQFGAEPTGIRDRLAILNIGAYPSATFEDWPMLSALPSSRVSVEWAQTILFPQAEAGERVVVCMRSAPYWGLGKAARYGKGLFAPAVNRRGHMLNEREHLPLAIRQDVIQAVRTKLAVHTSN